MLYFFPASLNSLSSAVFLFARHYFWICVLLYQYGLPTKQTVCNLHGQKQRWWNRLLSKWKRLWKQNRVISRGTKQSWLRKWDREKCTKRQREKLGPTTEVNPAVVHFSQLMPRIIRQYAGAGSEDSHVGAPRLHWETPQGRSDRQ